MFLSLFVCLFVCLFSYLFVCQFVCCFVGLRSILVPVNSCLFVCWLISGSVTGVAPCTSNCIQANARAPVLIENKENRLVKASKVYSGSSKSWKNLYRFYSACRQTILFTWRGGMGVILLQIIQGSTKIDPNRLGSDSPMALKIYHNMKQHVKRHS